MGIIRKDDGTFRRVKEIPEVLTENVLRGLKDRTEAQLAVVDAVKALSFEAASFAASVVAKYRDPISRQQMTWEQAVENMSKPMADEIAEIEEVLNGEP